MTRDGVRWLPVAVLLLATCSVVIDGERILGIFPFQSKSHWIMGSALMKELAKRGHEVTMISHFPEKQPVANYTDIYVKTTMADVDSTMGTPNKFFNEDANGLVQKVTMIIDFLYRLNQETCNLMLQEEGIQKLIHDTNAHFDLVIMEAFFNECFLGFVHQFKAPLVQICTFSGLPYMGDWVGNPTPYSYVPDVFLPHTDRMNFWQRTLNTLMSTFMRTIRPVMYLPGQDKIMRKHFGFLEGLPYISELESKTSLVLANHHFSIGFPRPLMPNFVEVGGLHVKPPKKLPEDLQKYMDDAPNGVIYFSLGGNLQSSQMPEATRDALLKAFSQLKQKVLWKWETDSLPGQPSNVKTGKWLPQSDILAHPNLRLFITHGGLLSTQEALNRGVPVVGIPVFADQLVNMKRAEIFGYGVMVEFKNVSTESLTWAINEVLEKPSYRENAQRISRIFRDQPMTPLQKAIYWIEYIIRHKGAPHLRSAVLDLAWYQYFLLDVIGVMTLAFVTIILVIYSILKVTFKLCCGRKRVDKAKKRN